MLKVNPHPDYPPQEGRYIRGNDYSSVAVVIILNADEDKIPIEIQRLVNTGIESGAALSGSVQTPNIGIEKIVCNVVSNTNIRYIVLGGPESEYLTGDAIKSFTHNGIDENRRIIGTDASNPFLFNLPIEYINRFRKQVKLIDLQFKKDPEIIKQAVLSCQQKYVVKFFDYNLYDPGAISESPLSGKITWNITFGDCENCLEIYGICPENCYIY